jgi:hypothetical protein
MGRYLRDARHHAERIEYYYKHAGTAGYSQAEYHWNELSGLILRAARSKNEQSDAAVIQGIRQSLKPMMDEMRQRSTNQNSE